MQQINLLAHAKINLYLDVVGKLPDGYHEIKTILQTISLSDEVILSLREKEVTVKCRGQESIPAQENLAWKAAKYLQSEAGTSAGVDAYIKKNIPIKAGLGGASADAAATIKGLNKLWNLKLSQEQLLKIGEKIGLDVPALITGGSVLAEGKGERLTPLPPICPLYVIIMKPYWGLKTKDIYKRYDELNINLSSSINDVIQAIKEKKFDKLCDSLDNALQKVVEVDYPDIELLLDKSKEAGSKGALMSGSGSSVFALFNTLDKMKKAAGKLKDVCSTVIETETVDAGVEIYSDE